MQHDFDRYPFQSLYGERNGYTEYFSRRLAAKTTHYSRDINASIELPADESLVEGDDSVRWAIFANEAEWPFNSSAGTACSLQLQSDVYLDERKIADESFNLTEELRRSPVRRVNTLFTFC